MSIYAGLDVSDKTTHVCIVDNDGAVLKRGHELGPVLAPVERRLLKLVAD